MKSTPVYTQILGILLLGASAFVPAAVGTTINLNDPNLIPPPVGTGTINEAIFTVNDLQPAGTGVIEPFLSIQNTGTQQGYSGTDGNFDTKRVPQWNQPIEFGSLAEVSLNNTAYFQFTIDVNEPNNPTNTISLDMLNVWTSATTQSSDSVGADGLFDGSLGTLRYSMSSFLGENQVLYNDAHHGSGQADISIYIPVSNFAGTAPTDLVYMYQAWGNTLPSDGGFEETFSLQGMNTTPVPEVATFVPLALILGMVLGSDRMLRRRQQEALA